jgi:hypothetical protein
LLYFLNCSWISSIASSLCASPPTLVTGIFTEIKDTNRQCFYVKILKEMILKESLHERCQWRLSWARWAWHGLRHPSQLKTETSGEIALWPYASLRWRDMSKYCMRDSDTFLLTPGFSWNFRWWPVGGGIPTGTKLRTFFKHISALIFVFLLLVQVLLL